MPLLVTVLTGVFDLPTRKELLENPSALIDMTLALSAMAAVPSLACVRLTSCALRYSKPSSSVAIALRELLGSGGMGEVYLAEHQLLRRPCAIKIIRPERAGDAKMLRGLNAKYKRRQAEPLEQRLHLRLRSHSRWHLVLCDGVFAGTDVARTGDEVRSTATSAHHLLAQQSCSALHEAHGLGLIHRDVKPATSSCQSGVANTTLPNCWISGYSSRFAA